MPNQAFAYHVTLHYYEDNEWLNNSIVSKARKLCLQAKGDLSHPSHEKARALLKPHVIATFDRERVVDKISDIIAPVDEDGWRYADDESLTYGLRKSIFSPIDPDEYEPEVISKIDISNLLFCPMNDDDELLTDQTSDAMTITIVCTFAAKVKKELADIDQLESWLDKFEIDFTDIFRVDLSDSITTYFDEDGDETSGYSNATLDEGYLMATPSMSVSELREIALEDSLGNDAAEVELSDEAKNVLSAISSADIPILMQSLQGRPIDKPLVPGSDATAPMPIVFSGLLDSSDQIAGAINSLDSSLDFRFPEQKDLVEIIYALASMGANLQYKIGGEISYLQLAISNSRELTDFLLSFGLNALGEGGDTLLIAAEAGELELVENFLMQGADPNHATSGGTTAIHLAAQGAGGEEKLMSADEAQQYIKIVDLLLSKGADIAAIDDGGDSVLTNATRVNSLDMVKHLIANGANVNPQKKGAALSPLKIAKDLKFTDIENFLEQQGAVTTGGKPPAKSSASTKKNKGGAPKKQAETGKSDPDVTKKKLELAKGSDRLPCPSCGKTFTANTLRKWNGRCNACFRSAGGVPKKKSKPSTRPRSTPKKSTSSISSGPTLGQQIGSFFNGLFEFLDALVELIKALFYLAIVLFIFGAIIAAIFGG